MTYGIKWSPRAARLRAPLLAACFLAFAGCDANDALEPDTIVPTDGTDLLGGDEGGLEVDGVEAEGVEAEGVEAVPIDDPVLAAATRRGIPIGHFAQPLSSYGSLYNGGHGNFSPRTIVKELSAIRARGGRVVIPFAGSPRYYRENGRFSLSKWKARVNRFRHANLSQFINDGTIIGHYMIDEPNDPANWRGSPVPPSMLEQMAKYSKQLWPNMPTIVRVRPSYLSRNHRYLDAAWAQYLARHGSPDSFIRKNVADAKARRVGLVVGLNVLKGGKPVKTRMSASEVKSWGSTLLNSTYPCAFISWTYSRDYLSSRGMGDAMRALRRKAESRGSKSCRG
jgi:hypothetical protein